MVTLRTWWSHRWRGLVEWQRALLLTLVGGFVWSYGAPAVGEFFGSVSAFSRALAAGVVLIVALLLATRRRLVNLESRLRTHHRIVAIARSKTLLRLELLLADMSDSVPDGGRRQPAASPSWPGSLEGQERDGPSTWTLLSFVLVGNGAGLFLGLAAGLGDVGSPTVLALSVAGGAVAAAIRLWWWPGGDGTPDRPRRDRSGLGLSGPDSPPVPPAYPVAGDADLEALGRYVRAASDGFEVEMDDEVLKIRREDRS